MGGVVAAAVGGGTPPSDAEDVVTRGDEVVAREAPGKQEAGIAILRGNVQVRLLGERDGWSEILLGDGRRAWVPTAQLVRVPEAPPSPAATAPPVTPPAMPETSAPVPDPEAGRAAGASAPGRELQPDLAAEIARLRAVVDALEDERRRGARAEPAGRPDAVPLLAGGVGLVLGMLVGGAWERHRARRERSLRF